MTGQAVQRKGMRQGGEVGRMLPEAKELNHRQNHL